MEICQGERVKFQNEIYLVMGIAFKYPNNVWLVRLRKENNKSVEIRIPEKQFEEEATEVDDLFEALDKILRD